MSPRAARSRITAAAVVSITAALLAPTQGSAAAPAAAGRDTVEVSGTVLVVAGEHGDRDRYSLQLPSGRTIELADGFTAEPLSHFSGTLAAPGTGTGSTLTGSLRTSTLRRAAASGTPMKVVGSRVAARAAAPGPTAHQTYVARVTNFPGTFGLTDAQILSTINASQQYWVRESAGQIPSWTTVTGVAAVPSSVASAGCGIGSGGSDFGSVASAVAGAAYPGVDFSGASPNHLVIVVPQGCGGSTTGRARLGTSFASGGPAIVQGESPTLTLSTLNHEWGHNVGLQHANNPSAEYGNVYEVMGADDGSFKSPVLGTVYRWEQGIIAPGEVADASNGIGAQTLQPRAATGGLRSLVFVNPDDGKRYFVDYRNAAGNDAGTCYAASCDYTSGTYNQSFVPGIVVEREDGASGSFLASNGDGSLQAGQSWGPGAGRVTVTATAANAASVTIGAPSGAVAGGTATVFAPQALRDATAVPSGFSPTPVGYRYQWYLNGQPIPGAEDSVFRPGTANVGGALSVAITGYYPKYTPRTVTSAPMPVAPAGWYKSTASRERVEIAGTLRVGETLTGAGLDWVNFYGEKPADLSLTYRWVRNGATIPGATASTYRLTASDLGKQIYVQEVPQAAGYASTFSSSVLTARVAMGRLTTKRPTIAGKAKVGKRVVARTKGWTTGTRFRYQWFLGKKAIKGATKRKLQVTRSMRGKKLVVKVTGKKKGYTKATMKSRPKKVR